MAKRRNYMPPNPDIDQEETAMLTKTYQAAINWTQKLQQETEAIDNKYNEKLTDAIIAGSSEKKIADIKSKWEKELNEEPALEKLRILAKTRPKPTLEQQRMGAEALRILMEKHDKFVTYIIRKHFGYYYNTPHYDDVLQAGRMGMIQSLTDYNPEKSLFSTYTTVFIQHAVFDFTSELNYTSTYYQSQAKQYRAVVAKLMNDGNSSPSIPQIAGEMGVGIEAVQKLINVMNRSNYLSLNDESVAAHAVDPTKFSPEEIYGTKEKKRTVAEAVSRLPEEMQLIINLSYLENEKPEKYTTIGLEVAKLRNPGVPVEMLEPVDTDEIRRLKNKALKLLKIELSSFYAPEGTNKYVPPKKSSLSINLYPDYTSIIEDLDYIHDIDSDSDDADLNA